jgi:hypothetical protein
VELYLHSPNTPTWRGAQLGGAQQCSKQLKMSVQLQNSVSLNFRIFNTNLELKLIEDRLLNSRKTKMNTAVVTAVYQLST